MSSTAGAPIPDFQLPYTAYGYGGQNGRVNFNLREGAGGAPVPDSAGFSYPQKTEKSFSGDMLRGNWDHTALSDAFFTRKNANLIQVEIKKEIYRMSGPKKYVIDDQDVDELADLLANTGFGGRRNTRRGKKSRSKKALSRRH